MKYRFVQTTRNGLWVSPGVFDDTLETIVANIVRGHVHGQPRAAISVDDGRVIFALDAEGRVAPPEAFEIDRGKAA
jgi:hypothetical protein